MKLMLPFRAHTLNQGTKLNRECSLPERLEKIAGYHWPLSKVLMSVYVNQITKQSHTVYHSHLRSKRPIAKGVSRTGETPNFRNCDAFPSPFFFSRP